MYRKNWKRSVKNYLSTYIVLRKPNNKSLERNSTGTFNNKEIMVTIIEKPAKTMIKYHCT